MDYHEGKKIDYNLDLRGSVFEWHECFNFCTGRSPTGPPVWNSLLFLVAVLHLVVTILGAEYLHIGGVEYSGWG